MGLLDQIELDFLPVPKQRPRKGRNGSFYTPKKTIESEERIKWTIVRIVKDNDRFPIKGAVNLHIYFEMKKPKSARRDYPTVKPDIDNVLKTALDACNGVLFDDDKQIVKISAEQNYGPSDRTIIQIMSLD